MRVIRTFSLIGLLSQFALAKWPTVDETVFRDAIDTNEQTLVACKSSNCNKLFGYL